MIADNEDKELIKKWELLYGIIFISLIGSFFHFTFELSGFNVIVGSFSAVNESVWEHLKLVFFPLIIFSLIEHFYIKEEANNFVIAKAVASYLMPVTIVVIFYSYEFISGSHSFIVDISSFFIAVVVGQIVDYKILTSEKKPKYFEYISLGLIILLLVIFIIFTFYPPNLPIFKDGPTGGYGIVESSYLLQ